MKKLNFFYLAVLATFASFTSCKKEEPKIYDTYLNGAFITNEGSWGSSNASLSFFDSEKEEVLNDVFYSVNERVIGDLLQSATIYGNKIFMIVNSSNKIEVASYINMEEIATVEDLSGPRYMTVYNHKGYVTQWGNGGQVKVLNLSDYSIETTIDVGTGPEQIVEAGGYLFVANAGEYGVDSVLSVIDPSTNTVVKSIVVGDNPMEMVIDANDDLWVLCYGYTQYDENWAVVSQTPSKLVKVDVATQEKVSELAISTFKHPMNLDISADKETIYYGGDYSFQGIYAVDITATQLDSVALIDETKTFYGFNVNPTTGDIYALEAPTFTEGGTLYIYSSSGSLKDSYTVGIGPKSVVFVD